jgi:predicted AAA+ superfamily ATPase
VVLTGPRQSGKTTTLKHLFGRSHRYVSLEPPDVRAAASDDPRGFLDLNSPPVILDEVQLAPGLLPYIKERIDEQRGERGRYLLPGSQNLLLMEKVTESLAGRAAMLRLLPMTVGELSGRPGAVFPWESKENLEYRVASPTELWNGFLRGFYPEPALDPGRDHSLWHGSYLQTYIERDVRNLRQIGDLVSFQSFLETMAARSGQLLNLTDVARDLGLAVNTAKAWLSILEATFQIIILRPYFANVGKRLVKTPKIYFMDVGTLCHLTGLKNPEHAMSGPMGGAIFETAVITEIYKIITHRGEKPRLHFWRTSSGREVDLLLQTAGKLIPMEIKLSSTPNRAMAAGIRSLQQDLKGKTAPGYVVHPGGTVLPLGPQVNSLPFSALGQSEQD